MLLFLMGLLPAFLLSSTIAGGLTGSGDSSDDDDLDALADVRIGGTDDPDLLEGTEEGDNILGFGGSDTIYAFGGDDSISGNGEGDLVDGGEGNDQIDGNGGADSIRGGEGNDSVAGLEGRDTIDGGDGDDIIDGGRFIDEISGGDGNDTLLGGAGNDILLGEDGHDILVGEKGTDDMRGGDGDDVFDGLYNGVSYDVFLPTDLYDPDTLDGGEGNDTILAGAGDTLIGGPGDDVFYSGIWTEDDAEDETPIIEDFSAEDDLLGILVPLGQEDQYSYSIVPVDDDPNLAAEIMLQRTGEPAFVVMRIGAGSDVPTSADVFIRDDQPL